MASDLNRRLLLSILRTPPKVTKSTIQRQQFAIPLRSISTSFPRAEKKFSVSFGSDTDQLLESFGKKKPESERRVEIQDVAGKSKKNGGVKQAGMKKSKKKPLSSLHPSKAVTSDGSHQPVTEENEEHMYGEPVMLEIPDTSPATIARSRIDDGVVDTRTLPFESKEPRPKIIPPESKHTKSEPPSSSSSLESTTPPSPPSQPPPPTRKLLPWQIQKAALKQKFGNEGWNPRKKLSPDTIEGIRSLHERNPEKFTTATLSAHFKVSPEAIRRMLKSKWRPAPEVMDERRERWARRHDRIWDVKAELGQRPKRTRDKKVDGPEVFEDEIRQAQALGRI